MNTKKKITPVLCAFALGFGLVACGDDEPAPVDCEATPEDPACLGEEEVISRVTLTFTPAMGSPITAVFNDPDGEGGMAPTIDPITLMNGETYTLELMFENALETPAEDITEEIREEAEEHQVFFLGSAVGAQVMVAYADVESDYAMNSGEDLPVGIRATVTTAATGSGVFNVILAHQPGVKTATSDQDSGSQDVNIDFQLTVQ